MRMITGKGTLVVVAVVVMIVVEMEVSLFGVACGVVVVIELM